MRINRFSFKDKKQIWKFPKPEEIRRARNKASFSLQNEKSQSNEEFDKDHKSLFNEGQVPKSITIFL